MNVLYCSSQKNGTILGGTKASFLSGRKLRAMRKYTAPNAQRSVAVCTVYEPNRPLWFPGSVPPPYLDGSLPADFGFDPLGLCKFNPNNFLFPLFEYLCVSDVIS